MKRLHEFLMFLLDLTPNNFKTPVYEKLRDEAFSQYLNTSSYHHFNLYFIYSVKVHEIKGIEGIK